VTVPNVLNLTQGEATSKVESQGLDPSTIQQASTFPAGEVIQQAPLGGSRVDKGTDVTLTISTGPAPVDVPNVVGLSRASAVDALKRRGLKARVVDQSSSSTTRGQVISSDPDAGTQSQTGSTIVLYVSIGKAVPDVTGDSLATAQTTLENAGFTVSVTKKVSTETAGTVLSQTPKGGQSAASGSGVALVVSEAAVPQVTGQSSHAAKTAIVAAGYTVTETYQSVTKQSQNGIVLSQTPAGGATLSAGGTVTIVVGRYTSSSTTTATTTTATATTTTASTTTATSTPTTSSATTTGPTASVLSTTGSTTTAGSGPL
jgi:beta-lactam-binding protein with PASTA domain